MFVGLLSDVGNWKAFSDKLGANNVGYFPTINFPDSKYKDQQVAQGAGIGYGVMKWSKNQKLAAAYAKFRAVGRAYAAATGALSPNTSVTGFEGKLSGTQGPPVRMPQGKPGHWTTSRCSAMATRMMQSGSATRCSSQTSPADNSSSHEYQKLITKK